MSEVAGAILRAGIYQAVVKPIKPDAELRVWYRKTVGQEAPETMYEYTVTCQGEHVQEGTADTQENAILAAGMAIGENSARRTDAAMREVDRLTLAELDTEDR